MRLTEKYRPKTLDEITGQDELKQIIKNMIKNDKLMSFIMVGPPATGKTTIGKAIANELGVPLSQLNAVDISKKEMQSCTKDASTDNPVIIYIDEIHRLDTPKQEFFLPLIENGSVILIGATTESPYHKLTKALRSRLCIFNLEETSKKDKESIIDNILRNENIKITDEAKSFLISLEDTRVMINALDFASDNSANIITINDIKKFGKNHINGDQNGSYHYMMKAAFQKSIRGSNLDAALYYLSRMLNSGDLDSAIRRLKVIAYEDIGLGDTEAVIFAENAIKTAETTGLPEARIPMALATARLCLARKDNSVYKAYGIFSEMDDFMPPEHIRTECPKDYIYPHEYPNHIVKQQYMPDEIDGVTPFKQSGMLPDEWQAVYNNIRKIIY